MNRQPLGSCRRSRTLVEAFVGFDGVRRCAAVSALSPTRSRQRVQRGSSYLAIRVDGEMKPRFDYLVSAGASARQLTNDPLCDDFRKAVRDIDCLVVREVDSSLVLRAISGLATSVEFQAGFYVRMVAVRRDVALRVKITSYVSALHGRRAAVVERQYVIPNDVVLHDGGRWA